jgi:predicted DNA-binding protein (MmcQ/YjbR family)
MNLNRMRRICLALPHAAESVKWENNLVFTVDGKMFAVAALEPGEIWASFKCSPEGYEELLERPGVRPAPYLARAQWVALETPNAMPDRELERRLGEAYAIVFDKLPKKRRLELGGRLK